MKGSDGLSVLSSGVHITKMTAVIKVALLHVVVDRQIRVVREGMSKYNVCG